MAGSELADGECDAAKLHGGMTAATRLPSGSRESRIGFASEMSSPRRRAMFLTATMRDFSPSDMSVNLLEAGPLSR